MKFTWQTAGPAGKKGGSARSPRKAVSAVLNGKKGGRPKTINKNDRGTRPDHDPVIVMNMVKNDPVNMCRTSSTTRTSSTRSCTSSRTYIPTW